MAQFPPWSGQLFGSLMLNGQWVPVPTFPSVWYHPVLGQITANSMADLTGPGMAWFASPDLADVARTETEAELVITHDINLTLAAMTGATPSGTPANVNRRSAMWETVIRQGWGVTPLAAATQLSGASPPVEARQPGQTLAPGQSSPVFTQGAQTQQQGTGAGTSAAPGTTPPGPPQPRVAQEAAGQVSAGVPPLSPQASQAMARQHDMSGAGGQQSAPQAGTLQQTLPGTPAPGQQPQPPGRGR